MPQDEKSGQSQSGDNLYPRSGEGVLNTFNPRSFKAPREIIRLLRYLSSKWYFVSELSQQEILTFSEGLLRLESIQSRQFRKANWYIIDVFGCVLRYLNDKDNGRNVFWFEGGVEKLLNPKESGYHSEEKTWKSCFSKVRRVWKRVPPKAYIGRGYTDKGNCRDTALDSSPDWKDVASSRFIYTKGRPTGTWTELIRKDVLRNLELNELEVICKPGFLNLWARMYEEPETVLCAVPL